MDDYIERLMLCGWTHEQAYRIVNDFLRELDFDGLKRVAVVSLPPF